VHRLFTNIALEEEALVGPESRDAIQPAQGQEGGVHSIAQPGVDRKRRAGREGCRHEGADSFATGAWRSRAQSVCY
jgi:hypothetical protein